MSYGSKYVDEARSREAVYPDTLVFTEGDENAVKVFASDLTSEPTLEVGAWWDGNSGEWSPEYLSVNLDRSDVTKLRDHLTKWLEQTK